MGRGRESGPKRMGPVNRFLVTLGAGVAIGVISERALLHPGSAEQAQPETPAAGAPAAPPREYNEGSFIIRETPNANQLEVRVPAENVESRAAEKHLDADVASTLHEAGCTTEAQSTQELAPEITVFDGQEIKTLRALVTTREADCFDDELE